MFFLSFARRNMSDVTSDAYGKVFCVYIFLIEMRGYASIVLRYYIQFEMQLQLLVPFAFSTTLPSEPLQ
jgi:hypothetical protein